MTHRNAIAAIATATALAGTCAAVVLGLTNHPTAVTAVGGGVGLVLSIAAIVLLVLVNPRRAARRAAAAAAPSASSVAARW